MMPLSFDPLLGNEPVKSYLRRMIDSQSIGNSLLFSGPDGIGKSLFAYALASQLILKDNLSDSHRIKLESGNHPDIHIYRPEGKLGLHSMQTLKQLSEEVYLPPYEASWKIFIIHEADRMLSYSANALLKTFEEPPPRTMIILLSSRASAILPTILSRCRVVRFQPLTPEEMRLFFSKQEGESQAEIILKAQGSIGHALRLKAQEGEGTQQALLNILAKGSFLTYKELTEAAQQLADQVEVSKKLSEEAVKTELYKVPLENLSSYQQHTLEKELEGAVAMSYMNEATALLDVILSWYRDLHLLYVRGAISHLRNPAYEAVLREKIERGNILPLQEVQKMIEEAHLTLQRSTSLNICLENLFLKLHLI